MTAADNGSELKGLLQEFPLCLSGLRIRLKQQLKSPWRYGFDPQPGAVSSRIWCCRSCSANSIPGPETFMCCGGSHQNYKKCYFTQRARNATCPHKYTYISSKNAVQLLGYTVLVFKIYIQKYIRTHFGFYNLATHFFRFLVSYLLKGVKSLRAETDGRKC